jgi:hypothetical protein
VVQDQMREWSMEEQFVKITKWKKPEVEAEN